VEYRNADFIQKGLSPSAMIWLHLVNIW